MPIFPAGALNTTALTNPDVYVQIIPPQFLINGVPSNILALVGSAIWGPVNQPQLAGNLGQVGQLFGPYQNRPYDMGTYAAIAFQQGATAVLCSRVTDGTDTAASVLVQTNSITFTSKYTGSFGNQIQASVGPGSAASSYQAKIAAPGLAPEIFDNVTPGVASLTVSPGTGYTSVPALSIAAPTGVNPVQATAAASLLAISGTLGAAGSGYAANDTINLSNGVVIKVLTVSTGAIATFSVLNGGSLASGSTPANPVAQVSTSGSGTGGTFNLTWGLGPATIINGGSGYIATPAATLTGGGAGSGGSYTAVPAVWPNMANAINNGNAQRGPSQIIVASAGVGVPMPTTATYTLAGGTDGANAINNSIMLGQDTLPRTGMYALRGKGASVGVLCDLTDPTSWATQVSFGLGEGVYMVTSTASGDAPSTAATTKSTAGIDSYAMKIMLGDWVYWNDTLNGIPQRLVSPAAFAAGLLSALAPQNSSLNKPLNAVVGTQKSRTGVPYTSADIQTLAVAGIDVICNPVPGGAYFGCRTGRNASSNAVIHGDNYTRMTNYIATTLNAAMGIYVGKLNSQQTQRQAKVSLDAFCQAMADQGQIGSSDGSLPYSNEIDAANNPQNRVALGYLQANTQIKYLSIVEYFLINLEAGQSVQINRVGTQLQV